MRFVVPVEFTMSGTIEVEAEDAVEAIEAAKAEYDWRRKKCGVAFFGVVDTPDTEVDFACGDDPNEVLTPEDVEGEED